jgi:hypothetical protein
VSLHDGPAAGGRRAAVRERRATADAALETRLRGLGPALDGEPDPAFRAATRARLVAMAAVRSPAPAALTGWRRLLSLRADTAPRRRTRLTAGLAGAALAITVLATLVAVSTGARPGDVLYGLKRGTEQTQLALAGDARGATLLQFASTRLSELRGLRGDGDTALAVATLHTMDRQTTEAASWLTARAVTTRSSAPVAELADWADGQRAGLASLRPRLPEGARPAAAHSLDLLTRVGVRADAVAKALTCPAGPVTKGSDPLGPLPAPCAPPSSGSPAGTGGSGAPRGSLPPVSAPAGRTAGNGTGPGASGTTAGAGPTGVPGTGPIGGNTGGAAPTTPPLVNVPLPTLPLPGSPVTGPAGSTGASGSVSPPPPAPVPGVCLPPLITLGNC